ncbi:uncharacterized protein BcabD6B2_54760 [Babesia caballi]|uniref:Uncharacterized protein n=1 Tax=Babesia caballi TaxID=5871 RepID=A0AAV4M1E4_BABCB|nr:hypothetical protein, conserved [Babesia caballi]
MRVVVIVTKLSEKVKNLLESVKGSDAKPGAEIGKVTQALNSNSGPNGLIANLADGLQQFIGYETGGKIGTDGIAVSNLPVERLRDAVLMFIGPFLGVLLGNYPELTKDPKLTAPFNKAVEACKKGVGCGKDAFDEALQEVKEELGKVSGSNSGINAVLNKVKEVEQLKSKRDVQQLANGFKTYFTGVLDKVEKDDEVKKASAQQLGTKVQNLKTQLETLVTNVGNQKGEFPINVGQGPLGQQTHGLKNDIDTIYNGNSGALKALREAFSKLEQKTAAYALSAAAYNGANIFVSVLQTDYTSYYKDATWNQVSGGENFKKCAKIFLACLPLIFNGLSYFYWKWSDQGGWKTMTLGSPEPKAFMNIMTDKSRLFNGNKSASEIVSKAFGNFTEFSTAANGSSTSYVDFLKIFRGNCLTTWKNSSTTATDSSFLSGLYLCSTSYFRHQHQKKAAQARPPSSIREMLYWLMGLTATPQFGDLLGHIHNVVGTNFKVAVSGSSNKNETLSADQVTSYIISTCYTCPSVLDIIQGSLAFNGSGDDPWLHELYSNSQFNFTYPSSGAALFYALSDYTYALQFQLTFLYKQCSNTYTNACGWTQCTYGQGVNTNDSNGKVVSSHICPVGCTTSGHKNSDHASGYCEHADCGQGSNVSPLQAFLTDKLKGFRRDPSDPYSHLASCSGSLCHVPMGFDNHLRPGSKTQGGHISLALKPFCGSFNSPLRQLCGTLTCLSKRAPRSLGDLFGFYWQVTGQLFNDVKTKDNDPSNNLSSAFAKLFQKLTTVESNLLYASLTENVKAIGRHFFGLSWHCHKKSGWQTVKRSSDGSYCNDHTSSSKACDLMSLYDSECKDKTCGKYLEPLGISYGATFANDFAFTYLSWATYLTDDLYESLQEFLVSFNDLKCTGCKSKCSSHSSGSHGSQSSCHCRSVVDCADVLPLLYSNGFNFKDALSLEQQYKKTMFRFPHPTSIRHLRQST